MIVDDEVQESCASKARCKIVLQFVQLKLHFPDALFHVYFRVVAL